jgi:hypothetical protein
MKIKFGGTLSTLLFFLVIILNLHTLRNVTFLYLVVLFLISGFSFFYFICKINFFSDGKFFFIAAYLFLLFYLFAISLIYSHQYGDPSIGFVRAIIVSPLVLLLILIRSEIIVNSIYSVFLLFGFLSSLTIFYQWGYGTLSFLAEPGERVGLVRYASLSGSLTVFGSLVGVFIILTITLIKSSILRMLFFLVFFVAGFLSLQKAALISILLSFFIIIYFKIISTKFLAVFILLLVFFTPFLYMIAIELGVSDVFTLMIDSAFGSGDESLRSDVTVIESIFDRILELPSISVNFFGIWAFLTGVGVFGASGALGYPDYPMMHNLIGEIFITFGFFVGGSLVLFLFYVFYNALKLKNKSKLLLTSSAVYISVFIPSLFAGGLFYQPVMAGLFFTSLIHVTYSRFIK